MHCLSWLRYKAWKCFKSKDLAVCFQKKLLFAPISSYSEPWRQACRPWLSYFGFHFVPCWAFCLRFKLSLYVYECKAILMLKLMYRVYVQDSVVSVGCCELFLVKGWQTDMFRGLLWLFNSLHKEWGRAGGKGVMQFSKFVQFPALETVWEHSWACCYAAVFAISPPINEKSARVSVILQVSVWPLWTSRYCCSPLRDNSIFAILPGIILQAFGSRPPATEYTLNCTLRGRCGWVQCFWTSQSF